MNFPIMQKDLMTKLGDPRKPGWSAHNLKIVDLGDHREAFGPVRDYDGNHWNFRLLTHKLMEAPLKMAFAKLALVGVAKELKSYDGCFNVRVMKGGRSLSVHSWGMAVDFNAATNPFSYKRLVTDFSDEFIRCFLESGFEWGGLWTSPKDAMHFQLAWTKLWNRGPVPYKNEKENQA